MCVYVYVLHTYTYDFAYICVFIIYVYIYDFAHITLLIHIYTV